MFYTLIISFGLGSEDFGVIGQGIIDRRSISVGNGWDGDTIKLNYQSITNQKFIQFLDPIYDVQFILA